MIIISILVGWLMLKERVTPPRIAGSVCIAAGLVGLVLAG